MRNRPTQDVRTHVQDHDHEAAKIEELERKLREFEDADYHRRRQEERNQALREAEEAKSFKDRVGQVRQSFGGSLKNSMAYDKTNKVEAVNGLELLTGALKIAGGSKSVDLTTVSPTTVYNWLESCDRVRKLHPAIFDDFFSDTHFTGRLDINSGLERGEKARSICSREVVAHRGKHACVNVHWEGWLYRHDQVGITP